MKLVFGDRTITVSNPGKVLYPATGFTKSDVVEYYQAVAPFVLPHLRGRLVTLKRYPDGVEGGFFYEKKCPEHRPEWIPTAPMRRKQDDTDVHYCLLEDEAALAWSANLANLELHTSLSLAGNVERPTSMVFDLDPGPPAGLVECSGVAMVLRAMLDAIGMQAWSKSSGSKGLQLYVPLNTPVTYRETKPFAQAFARILEEEYPHLVLSTPKRTERAGKVFVDWSQNDRHKTTVCVFSLRAKTRPTVSTPVTWGEIEATCAARDPELLVFDHDEALRRAEKQGDLFEPVLTLAQELPSL